jgi:RNA polymerase sigma factor (sigma-70 family)
VRQVDGRKVFAAPETIRGEVSVRLAIDAAGDEDRGRTLGKASRSELVGEFDRIMRQYGPALARVAGSYEVVASRREELVQDIALAIWQSLPGFRRECSERTFIYRIAHNRGLTHAWRRPPAHDALEALPEAAQPIDPRPPAEEVVSGLHRRAQLIGAIQKLPLVHRQVIALMLEDLSQAEIGEVLGISENNAAVRMSRARKALRQAMGGAP